MQRVSATRRLLPVFLLIGLCWAILAADVLLWSGTLRGHGIVPRTLSSIPAILWAPLIHSTGEHLAANTFPLLILGALLCGRDRAEFYIVVVTGWLVTGALTWVFARHGSHIGASGLVFCFFGYVTARGFFSRSVGTLVGTAVALVTYGGVLRGVVPTTAPISWEAHLAGLITGVALAWIGSRS